MTRQGSYLAGEPASWTSSGKPLCRGPLADSARQQLSTLKKGRAQHGGPHYCGEDAERRM